MASNRRTPRSVLHAPKPEVIVLHETRGPNRQERRHGGFRAYVDAGGTKRMGFAGAKGSGYFKRTRVLENVRDRSGRRIQRLSPVTPFKDAYPTENVPYVRPAEPADDGVSGSWLRRWKRRQRT